MAAAGWASYDSRERDTRAVTLSRSDPINSFQFIVASLELVPPHEPSYHVHSRHALRPSSTCPALLYVRDREPRLDRLTFHNNALNFFLLAPVQCHAQGKNKTRPIPFRPCGSRVSHVIQAVKLHPDTANTSGVDRGYETSSIILQLTIQDHQTASHNEDVEVVDSRMKQNLAPIRIIQSLCLLTFLILALTSMWKSSTSSLKSGLSRFGKVGSSRAKQDQVVLDDTNPDPNPGSNNPPVPGKPGKAGSETADKEKTKRVDKLVVAHFMVSQLFIPTSVPDLPPTFI